jgi:hypothetical protein
MDHGLLSTYLNDHLAGATAGRSLAHRAAEAERHGPYGRPLQEIDREIAQDRESLVRIMRELGIRANPLKVGAGWLGERAGRLKTNRRLIHRSPLSRVVELEGLLLGVRGKLALWAALRTLAHTDPRIARAADIEVLADRAEHQLERLEELRLQAVQGVFLEGANDRD